VIDHAPIAENIARVRERIHAAARRAGRATDEITLMGVTKTVSTERIRAAYDAGLRVFGENRVQEFAGKIERLRELENAEWHMIGHLQSNKAGKAAELFVHIDSVDSLRLAHKLNSRAAELDKKLRILVEINIGGEDAKTGLAPSNSRELEQILTAAVDLPNLEISGLMTIPPYNDYVEQSRPYFRKLRELFEQISRRKFEKVTMEVLSMGMSHDFEVAIEEGASCVRVGTAIFGERQVTGGKN
jgi:PLP dependent protein